MVVETQRVDVPMALGMQQTEDKPMAACTRYSGDDLDTEAIHPFQWKNDKKEVDRDQTDGCRYSACGPRFEGQDQPQSKVSLGNGQKSDNCQHAADRLQSNGYVITDDNVEGCC